MLEQRDPVAVLYVMRGSEEDGMLRMHASVPYVSTLQHVSYPYHQKPVRKEFSGAITEGVLTLQVEFEQGPSRRSDGRGEVPIELVKKPIQQASRASYAEKLYTLSHKITDELHLDRIVEFLFSLGDEVELLQIFTDVDGIPWDWLGTKKQKRVLCESFGIGVTIPELRRLNNVLYARRDRSLTLKALREEKYSALVVGNSYVGTNLLLPDMQASLGEMDRVMREVFGRGDSVIAEDLRAEEVTAELVRLARTLRFIVLSGHFGRNGFRCRDTFFSGQDLVEAFEDSDDVDEFTAHPVVILNGCASGGGGISSRDVRYQERGRQLREAFLERGASACIFTSSSVRFQYGRAFMNSFLREFLTPGTAIGSAIRSARLAMDRGKCYEWALYHLMGDPTYVMIRED
jgi:hypothetical protein